MNTLTDKKFLDRTGLAVLVGQIASLKKQLQDSDAANVESIQEQIDALVKDLANEVDRAKAVEGDVEYTVGENGKVEIEKSLKDLIDDEVARAKKAEGTLIKDDEENEIDLQTQITNEVARAEEAEEDLAERATELETIKPEVTVTFGGENDPKGEDHNHKLTIKVALATEGETVKAESEASVDLTDLALDGMVSNTRLIEVTADMVTAAASEGKLYDADKTFEYTKEQYGDTVFVADHKYLVIEFNTNSAHEPKDKAVIDVVPVFLDVEDLFTDYKFEAEGNDYIKLEVTQDRQSADNKVVYTISVGDALQSVIDLVEGGEGKGRGVAQIDTDLATAETNIDTLETFVGKADGAYTLEAVEEDAAGVAVSASDTVIARLNDAAARLKALRDELGTQSDEAAEKNEDGSLKDETASAFSRIKANEDDLIKLNTYLSTYTSEGEGDTYVQKEGGILTSNDINYLWDVSVEGKDQAIAAAEHYGSASPNYTKN